MKMQRQLPCLHLCKSSFIPKPGCALGFRNSLKHSLSLCHLNKRKHTPSLTTTQSHCNGPTPKGKPVVGGKGNKDNVWSLDNNAAKANSEHFKRRGKGRRLARGKKRKTGNIIMVSGPMLMDVETVLQTQEPVIRPIWNTFASSVSGIWKGVGAVFSPITAEMEPIEVGNLNENLYDCYTLSCIEAVPPPSGGRTSSHIQRKINWVTLNPYGEVPQHVAGRNRSEKLDEDENMSLNANHAADGGSKSCFLPDFRSFDFATSDVMEEETMGNEPGLVFFERRRTQPSEPAGSWKVFEMSATPIFGEELEMITGDSNTALYVYLWTETLKKGSLPENPVYFGEEEMADMQDITVLWLLGGVTGYVDVGKDGVLCIGVGWYSDEGINLVMERDYGVDGKLEEVGYKSEVKRRWSDPLHA